MQSLVRIANAFTTGISPSSKSTINNTKHKEQQYFTISKNNRRLTTLNNISIELSMIVPPSRSANSCKPNLDGGIGRVRFFSYHHQLTTNPNTCRRQSSKNNGLPTMTVTVTVTVTVRLDDLDWKFQILNHKTGRHI